MGKLTKEAYVRMCDENMAWLKNQPDCLEKMHIETIVADSPERYYDDKRLIASLEAELKEEKLQHGFTQISLDSTKTHLNSCETALSSRDDRIEKLEKWLRELIVDVSIEDFANLDIETTLDAYGLSAITEKDNEPSTN